MKKLSVKLFSVIIHRNNHTFLIQYTEIDKSLIGLCRNMESVLFSKRMCEFFQLLFMNLSDFHISDINDDSFYIICV